MHKTADLG